MSHTVAIIGAGPSGLMAADVLSQAGIEVDVYDAMPSPGRKFLLAGVGGMNITHAEPFVDFQSRYGEQQSWVAEWLARFSPDQLRAWIQDLGIETFVGTSGRVFPREMKAAPLLRRWLQRLRQHGVRLHSRHRWIGWDTRDALQFSTPDGGVSIKPDAVVLALGGGSWPRLGSDGSWLKLLGERGVPVSALQPANCGFDVVTAQNTHGWSAFLVEHFAGAALKNISMTLVTNGVSLTRKGECIVTATSVEGGLVYALSRPLREVLAAQGSVTILLDLLPDRPQADVLAAVSRVRGKQSLASGLRKSTGIQGVKAALLRENFTAGQLSDPVFLAGILKAFPLQLSAARPLAEAISTAGGIARDAVTPGLMLRSMPGVFCAGEMLDWEAPTGGYLLTACCASGRVAAEGVLAWLKEKKGC